MKKITCFAIILMILASLTLCGCEFTEIVYDKEETYSSGNATISDEVTELDIDWTQGMVKIQYHDEDTILLEETANKDISEDLSLRYNVTDGELAVKYAKSGYTGVIKNIRKTLVITLPKDKKYEKISFSVASADIKFSELNCDELEISSASGDVDIALDTIDEAEISTASGTVTCTANSARKIEVQTASGDMVLDINEVKNLDLESSSGNIKLTLPKESNFTLDYDTSSGNFDSDLAYVTKGSIRTAGTGDWDFDIETSSGNLEIIGK